MKLEKIAKILTIVGPVVAALGLTVAGAAAIAKVIYNTPAARQCGWLGLAVVVDGAVIFFWGLILHMIDNTRL